MKIASHTTKIYSKNFKKLNAVKNNSNLTSPMNNTKNNNNISFGMATAKQVSDFVEFTIANQTLLDTPQGALEAFSRLGVKAEIAPKENPNNEDRIILSEGYETNEKLLRAYNIDEEKLLSYVKEVKGNFRPLEAKSIDIDKIRYLIVDKNSRLKKVKVQSCVAANLGGKELEIFEADDIKGLLYIGGTAKKLSTIIVRNNCGDTCLDGGKGTFEVGNIKHRLWLSLGSDIQTIKVAGNCGSAHLNNYDIKALEANNIEGELLVGGFPLAMTIAKVKKCGSISTSNKSPISYPILEKVSGDFRFSTLPILNKGKKEIGGKIALIDENGQIIKEFTDINNETD